MKCGRGQLPRWAAVTIHQDVVSTVPSTHQHHASCREEARGKDKASSLPNPGRLALKMTPHLRQPCWLETCCEATRIAWRGGGPSPPLRPPPALPPQRMLGGLPTGSLHFSPSTEAAACRLTSVQRARSTLNGRERRAEQESPDDRPWPGAPSHGASGLSVPESRS